jgi:glutathionyl-hydroquinone reductase
MNIKRYKNELILIASIIFMLISYGYKNSIEKDAQNGFDNAQKEYSEIVKADKLYSIWANKHITTKIKVLQNIVPLSKVEWNQKGKKLFVKYHKLNAQELNKVLNKLLNLPVQIEDMNIVRKDKVYNLEFKCKL